MKNITIKKLIIGILALIVLVILIATISNNNTNTIDRLPEESSEIDYTDQARIVEGEELFELIGGPGQYDAFSRDLFVFARTNYKDYQDHTDKIVGFELKTPIQRNGDELVFDGRFGSFKNTISVKIKLLNNERIYTSITDKKANLNIDTKLPSNSKRNQYISSLPIDKDEYTIGYIISSDSFLIKLHINNTQADPRAELAAALGVENLENENVSVLGVGEASDRGINVPQVNNPEPDYQITPDDF